MAEDIAFITVKDKFPGMSRSEYSYKIPVKDAEEMLQQICKDKVISKVRYTIMHGGHMWEIDEFRGNHEGLVLAEVELKSVDEPLDIPDWIGEEVTHDMRYRNSYLIENPHAGRRRD